MQARLRGTLPVHRLLLHVEMARWQPDPLFPALCEAALARGRFDERAVTEALGKHVPAPARRRLLAHCERLGLRAGQQPTPLADSCARLGRTPAPEVGVYELWVADHPELRGLLLHVARRWQGDLRGDEQARPLPEELPLPASGAVPFESVLEPGVFWSVRRFPEANGLRLGVYRTTETWSVERLLAPDDVDAPDRLRLEPLEGSLDAEAENADRPSTSVERAGSLDAKACRRAVEDLVVQLAGHLGGRWDRSKRRLLLPGPEQAERAGEAFLLAGSLPSAEWEEVDLLGVPVGPADANCARKWTTALLAGRLARRPTKSFYLAAADVASHWKQLAALPALRAHAKALPCPSPGGLAEAFADRPELSMALAAALDLLGEADAPPAAGAQR